MTHPCAPAKANDRHGNGLSSTLATAAACLAVAVCPLALRLPWLPVGMTPSELLLAVSAALLAPAAYHKIRTRAFWRPLMPGAPFVACAALSATCAADKGSAIREFAQLILYTIVATSVFFTLFRVGLHRSVQSWALRGAVVVALVLMLVSIVAPPGFRGLVAGSVNGLACCTSLLLCLLLLDPHVLRSHTRWLDKPLVVLTPVICLILLFSVNQSHITAANPPTQAPTQVPQRCLEGYAALGVLSEYPLLGVGIGNYQLRIGEFYQGMPKENTVVFGTRIGYGVLLASTGILGLTSFLHWILSLFRTSGNTRLSPYGLRAFFLVLLAWAFFTPILTGQILLPLAVAQSIVFNCRRTGHA